MCACVKAGQRAVDETLILLLEGLSGLLNNLADAVDSILALLLFPVRVHQRLEVRLGNLREREKKYRNKAM